MLSRPYEKRKGGKEGKFKGGNTSIGEGGGEGGDQWRCTRPYAKVMYTSIRKEERRKRGKGAKFKGGVHVLQHIGLPLHEGLKPTMWHSQED